MLEVGSNEYQGEWHLASWPGAVLRGTWHNGAASYPFALRESYAGGVRVEVQKLRLAGGQSLPTSAQSGSDCDGGSYDYEYLQFPAAGAVAPALRRAIGKPPAAVRRQLRADYDAARNQRREIVEFLLNYFNLLSYRVECSSSMAGDGGKGDYWSEAYLFDLATGRELTLTSQLQPGYVRPMRRILRQHLLHDPQFDLINREHRYTWNWQDSTRKARELAALTGVGVYDASDHITSTFLIGSGLQTTYHASELYEDDEPMGRVYTLVIPYRELRPLVRPGTPLARILRARGL